MTKPPKKESPKASVSPSSGYLLYGRGSREEYDREVLRVKEELRQDLYGPTERERKKSGKKKKTNVAAILAFAAAILSILVAAVFAILVETGRTIGGRDLIREIVLFVTNLSDLKTDVAFWSGVCALTATVFVLTTMIGAAVSVKRPRVGYLFLTGTILWLVALVAFLIIEVVRAAVVPTESVILTILSAIAVLCAAVGSKKTGGK